MLFVMLLSLIGLSICLYGFYVEQQLKRDEEYKAVCDLSDQVSCTKTFLSPWGKMLGVSNIYVGIAFYLVMIGLSFLHQCNLAFLAAVAASVASLYLAYILYAKVKTFCLICISLYVINALLLVVTYYCL